MPSGLLYRLRGTADVWRLYFDYEPAPTGDLYATPPLEVPLAHGDEVSPLQPFLISVGGPADAAPLKPPFHFVGVLVGRKEAGRGMQQCAMLRAADGRACLAGLSSGHLAKGTGPESYSNELTIEEFNASIASHPVRAVLACDKLMVEGLARRSERTPSTAALAAAPAAKAGKKAALALAKAALAKKAAAERKAAAEKAAAERKAAVERKAAAEKAAAAAAATPPVVGLAYWYQTPSRRKTSVVVMHGPRQDGKYQVCGPSGGRIDWVDAVHLKLQQPQPQQPPWQPQPQPQPPFTGAIPWAAATPMWQQQQPPPMWQQQQPPSMWQQQQQQPQTPKQQQPQPHQQDNSPPGSVRALKKQIRGLSAAQVIPGQQPEALAARALQIDGLQTDLEERERKFRKYGHW